MRVLRSTGLAWFFLAIFAVSVVGLAIAGRADFNEDEVRHARMLGEVPETVGMGRYLVSSHFWQAMMENWQSEYLQFALYIAATVWLVQRGSPESKAPGDEGVGGPRRLRPMLYENSLVALMATFFVLSWFAQLVTGRIRYNGEQLDHQEAGLTLWQYAGTADFWSRTLQNWQSEFLAVASMVIFSVYLRQRGSPESKPVDAPHTSNEAIG